MEKIRKVVYTEYCDGYNNYELAIMLNDVKVCSVRVLSGDSIYEKVLDNFYNDEYYEGYLVILWEFVDEFMDEVFPDVKDIKNRI